MNFNLNPHDADCHGATDRNGANANENSAEQCQSDLWAFDPETCDAMLPEQLVRRLLSANVHD